MALKAVHDIPEMWSANQYRQILQALEFDNIDDIETAELFGMTVIALQDLKPETAAEAVTIPDAPAIIWYCQTGSHQEANLQLVVYSSWYWLRPLKNIRQYQSTAS